MSATPTQPLRAPVSDTPQKEPVDWVAIYLLTGFFAYIFVGYVVAPKFPGDTFGVILGYMAGWVTAYVMFKWGTSQSSKNKDTTIANLTK